MPGPTRRKHREDNEQKNALPLEIPETPEQAVRKSTLQNKISEIQRQFRLPIKIILSLITLGIMSYLLLRFGPFRRLYDSWYMDAYNSGTKDFDLGTENAYKLKITPIRESMAYLEKHFSSFARIPDVKATFNNLTISQLAKTPLDTIKFPTIEEALVILDKLVENRESPLTEELDKRFRGTMFFILKGVKQDHPYVEVPARNANYSVLFQATKAAHLAFEEMIAAVFPQVRNQTGVDYAKAALNKPLLAIQTSFWGVGSFVLHHLGLVNPVSSFFTRMFTDPPPVFPNAPHLSPPTEAYINRGLVYINEKYPVAQRVRYLTLAAATILPVIAYINLSRNEESRTPEMVGVFTILMSETIGEVLGLARSGYSSYRLLGTLKSMAAALKNITSILGDSVQVQSTNGGTLETSDFLITIPNKYQGLSASRVTSLLQNTLSENGVNIAESSRNQISILATELQIFAPSTTQNLKRNAWGLVSRMPPSPAEKIKALFTARLNRSCGIKILIDQLRKIFKQTLGFNEFEFTFITDAAGLPAISFTLKIDTVYIRPLQDLMPDLEFQDLNDTESNITIYVDTPFASDAFDVVNKSLGSLREAKQLRLHAELQRSIEENSSAAASPATEDSIRRRRDVTYGQKSLPSAQQPRPRPVAPIRARGAARVPIVWNTPNGAFNFNFASRNNNVHPIQAHHLRAGEYSHFAVFELTLEDFARYPGAYEIFRRIITQDPIFVPPDANQGLVRVASDDDYLEQRDVRHRRRFIASLKAKTPPHSTYGSARVFSEAFRSPTGETLHVFKSFMPHAH